MAGGSCLHIMKSAYPEGFEEPVIATLLREVLKGLVYLHAHGHIHRDVKVWLFHFVCLLDVTAILSFSLSAILSLIILSWNHVLLCHLELSCTLVLIDVNI